jgi:hypothetical protein
MWLDFLQSRGFKTQSVHESFVVDKHHIKLYFYCLISKPPFNHYPHSELDLQTIILTGTGELKEDMSCKEFVHRLSEYLMF